MLRRDVAAARERVEQVIALATDHGFTYWHAMALALRGWVQVQEGAISAGVDTLEQALAALESNGAKVFSTYILAFLTEAHLRAGAHNKALAAVETGLSIAESTVDRGYWPDLWRLKGELLLATAAPRPDGRKPRRLQLSREDRRPTAEQCFLRARDLAREHEVKSLELRIAVSLARAWEGGNRAAEGRAALDDICGWFASECDTGDLQEARALLQRLTPSRQPPNASSRSSRPPRFPRNYRRSSGL
jgi:predicted ATPase